MLQAKQEFISANQQSLFFIQSLFKEEPQNAGKSISLSVKDKYDGIPFRIEVNANTIGSFVAYRVITSAGEGLWSTWEDPEHAKNTFKSMSLI